MGDIQITITASNAATGNLTMTNEGVNNAFPGDQIIWVIQSGSGVSAITSITPKPDSVDIFTPTGTEPAPLQGSINWQGTINPSIAVTERVEYNYTINWTAPTGGGWLGKDPKSESFDPKIIVNPINPTGPKK